MANNFGSFGGSFPAAKTKGHQPLPGAKPYNPTPKSPLGSSAPAFAGGAQPYKPVAPPAGKRPSAPVSNAWNPPKSGGAIGSKGGAIAGGAPVNRKANMKKIISRRSASQVFGM